MQENSVIFIQSV